LPDRRERVLRCGPARTPRWPRECAFVACPPASSRQSLPRRERHERDAERLELFEQRHEVLQMI
jgi:hypothetical protein